MVRLQSVVDGLARALSRRHGALLLLAVVYLPVALGVRVALLVQATHSVSWDWSLVAAFAWGFIFDLGAFAWLTLPMVLLLTLLPAGAFGGRWGRGTACAVGLVSLFLMLFGAVAEWLFWEEFAVRFNFIAVDYLVYTTEVLGNIRESYPLPVLFSGMLLGAAVLFVVLWRTGLPRTWLGGRHETWPRRWLRGSVLMVAAVLVGSALSHEWLPAFENNYNRELAKNGLWSLVAAFRTNELDFERFYTRRPIEETFTQLRHELVEDGSVLLRPDELDTLRFVSNPGPELRLNVVQITVESLSAEFVGVLNPDSPLSPNLDAIAARSLVFENVYATGTRTDRGMEALSLSLPPTPGRSIIKRPHNEEMFTLGSVMRTRGYDTAFIYGGFGYFDNMNYFFSHNGYRVVDRGAVAAEDITFANAWGACDEDLYRWTIREADAAHAAGRPFHHFVMTTSNHRPYTFPDGRIDLPSKTSGRAGAVKYTDHAIGAFLRAAETKPWFRDTVFVIVADHCASSAGRTEIPVRNYHIPLIVYAPGGQIAPGRVRTTMSQMDFAPTLLGLLNWSYPSRFFGHDVRRIDPEDAHALVGTYQKLGHLERGELVVLQPRGQDIAYHVDDENRMHLASEPSDYGETEAISFYQAASHMYRHRLYRALSAAEEARYTAMGKARSGTGSPTIAVREER